MKALICGSFAFDTIMVFPDQFKNHILPDKVHILNVSFMVPDMRREFGGCAGNIAYNLNLLSGQVLPMGTVGHDFEPYERWIDNNSIDRSHVKVIDDTFTAQAFITTDLDDNQITAFHPGAMGMSHFNKVTDARDISIGIISPDGRDGMIEHATQFADANIPFIFDPGQGMPMFNGEELTNFVDQATWMTLNDYEWQMFQKKTGLSLDDVKGRLEALIVTRGSEGSRIHTKEKFYEIPIAMPEVITDPTGCGDAFRAGILYGLMNDMDWETTGRLAALMGMVNIEHNGTQNHAHTKDELFAKFEENFSYSI
ncbi:MAG: carbohydrate kinase family protein [Gammaproteobacteria bacterium]|nr:carbohydrate kinase family protein [Gammaproteobacteria bacterium]NIN62175.1 carbohydrate kinase family protein [Gammaproteobacteria bacterium]NIO61913.1 carbohydrate kinase family protein [Gammaproteobacteria bacterium]NIP49067.1 carbohydrate kinase family protein [Gammaproteobacteria bacterium]NIQ09523.1 carbohydrate kinase family protein [Gammaproteobacteria bacterium]